MFNTSDETMAEPVKYEFEMTREFARGAITGIEQVLWLQNERLHAHLEARMRFRSWLRWVGIVLSVCALFLALLGLALMPSRRWFFIAMTAAFALLLVIFAVYPVIAVALRRFARRMAALNARRLMQPVAARAPYKIVYELNGKSLLTRAEALQLCTTLDFQQVRVAVASPSFICVFRSQYAQRPLRVLYVPGPKEHAALSAALAANGAECLVLPTGQAG